MFKLNKEISLNKYVDIISIFFMRLLCQLMWDPFIKLKINTKETFAGEDGYLQAIVKCYGKNILINQIQ